MHHHVCASVDSDQHNPSSPPILLQLSADALKELRRINLCAQHLSVEDAAAVLALSPFDGHEVHNIPWGVAVGPDDAAYVAMAPEYSMPDEVRRFLGCCRGADF